MRGFPRVLRSPQSFGFSGEQVERDWHPRTPPLKWLRGGKLAVGLVVYTQSPERPGNPSQRCPSAKAGDLPGSSNICTCSKLLEVALRAVAQSLPIAHRGSLYGTFERFYVVAQAREWRAGMVEMGT